MIHKFKSYLLFSFLEILLIILSRLKIKSGVQGLIDTRWGFETLLREKCQIERLGKGVILEKYEFENFISNFYLRKNSTDFLVFSQVIRLLEYKEVCNLTSGHEIRNIIDCGANVGYTTLYFRNKFPDATIISVEPDIDNFEALKRNLLINNCSTDTCINAGIWDKDTLLTLNKEFRDGREWSFSLKEEAIKGDIQVYKIDTLMKMFSFGHVDLLKIDIEGGENALFENDKSLLGYLPYVKLLVLEIHDEIANREFIIKRLLYYNFDVFETDVLTIAKNKNIYAHS